MPRWAASSGFCPAARMRTPQRPKRRNSEQRAVDDRRRQHQQRGAERDARAARQRDRRSWRSRSACSGYCCCADQTSTISAAQQNAERNGGQHGGQHHLARHLAHQEDVDQHADQQAQAPAAAAIAISEWPPNCDAVVSSR